LYERKGAPFRCAPSSFAVLQKETPMEPTDALPLEAAFDNYGIHIKFEMTK
jgi:hypothetical protein